MAYNNSIPQPGDQLKNSQSEILDNFAAIKTAQDQNHVALDGSGSGDEGKHKFLQMPEQGAAPTTAANEAGLYAASGTTSMVSELLFRREGNGSSIAFTEGLLNTTATGDGWARFANGSLVKWGQIAVAGLNGNSSLNRTFPFPAGANIPVFSTAPWVMPVFVGSSFSNSIQLIGNAGVADFTLRTDVSGTGTVNFIAIGT